MNSEQFVQDAIRTESRPDSLGLNLGATLIMLEALVAAGNVGDTLKRGIYYGKGLNKDKLAEQLAILKAVVETAQAALPRIESPDQTPGLTAPNLRLLHCSLGMFTESGELLENIQKHIRGGTLDLVNFGEEISDCHWYAAIGHDETGVSIETSWETVVAKLKKRYGEKFASDAAYKRNLDAEREVLEESLSVTQA